MGEDPAAFQVIEPAATNGLASKVSVSLCIIDTDSVSLFSKIIVAAQLLLGRLLMAACILVKVDGPDDPPIVT